MKKHLIRLTSLIILSVFFLSACKSKYSIDPKEEISVTASVSSSVSTGTETSASSSDSSAGTSDSGSETSTSAIIQEIPTIAINVINLTEYKTGDIFVASFDMDAADPNAELPGPYGHIKELDGMSSAKVTMDWPYNADVLFFYLYNVSGERVLVTNVATMSTVSETVTLIIKINDAGELRIDATVN